MAAHSASATAHAAARGDLSTFDITPQRGFLPKSDPLQRLGREFDAWEHVAGELGKLLMSDQLRGIIDAMPNIDASSLKTAAELERAMLLLSYIGHAYVWCEAAPATRIPATLAIPWHAVGQKVGRPPVLSYASYALHNWRRLDSSPFPRNTVWRHPTTT